VVCHQQQTVPGCDDSCLCLAVDSSDMCRHVVEDCDCARALEGHMHGVVEIECGRYLLVHVESGLLGGRTGLGCRSGLRAGCLEVCSG
jgi:hypothetical protein